MARGPLLSEPCTFIDDYRPKPPRLPAKSGNLSALTTETVTGSDENFLDMTHSTPDFDTERRDLFPRDVSLPPYIDHLTLTPTLIPQKMCPPLQRKPFPNCSVRVGQPIDRSIRPSIEKKVLSARLCFDCLDITLVILKSIPLWMTVFLF